MMRVALEFCCARHGVGFVLEVDSVLVVDCMLEEDFALEVGHKLRCISAGRGRLCLPLGKCAAQLQQSYARKRTAAAVLDLQLE